MIYISQVYQACFGIVIFLGIAWFLSENRRKIDYKFVCYGVILQIILALFITKIPLVQQGFLQLGQGMTVLKNATAEGTKFVFGYLGGDDIPFVLRKDARAFIFAFQPLPMIIVISALSMLLFHWNVLPIIVRFFSWGFRKTLNIGGALGVCAAAKIFLGQTDAPLLIRPYLPKLSRSELFTVMTAGMATTSSTIIVIYAQILENTIAYPLSHILTASIINIPAAITFARLLIPQVGELTSGDIIVPYKFSSSMDAISHGATEGMKLFLNIIAMLIVSLALVALANSILGSFPDINHKPVTLQRIFGFFMGPLAWLMGIPWEQTELAGNLLGTKIVLNEIIAFRDLSFTKNMLSNHTKIIMTYALCGFANLSSIGIQIGGLGLMAPEQRKAIIELAPKALLAGTLSSCLSGTIMGLLFWIS